MADMLTPAQQTAVENRGGKILVSAAAGSGKTKVLVDRLMSYLTDPKDPANIDDFLIITYTKAAAAELRGKIADKLNLYITEHPENRHMQQQIQRLYLAKVSTVHAFCADILREYAYRLDISADFRIAEDNECQEIMFSVLEQLLDDAYSHYLDDEAFTAFVDSQGLGRDDRQVPEIILQIYSSALCHLNPEQWLDQCVAATNVEGLSDASQTVWGAYLLNDLKAFLELQINALENCVAKSQNISGLEKPVSLLSATICDLKSLQSCQCWDDVVVHPPIEYGTLTFKKEHKGTALAEQIKAVRNHCKDALSKKLRAFGDDSMTVLEQLQKASIASQGLVALVNKFRYQYDKAKRSRHVLDFSDIEQKTLDLLFGKSRSGRTAVADEISTRFREIMVDEYQDSNEVQDAIFDALTYQKQNCFMVGDVKQSIYQFRLADPGIFLKKYNTYAPAKTASVKEGRKVMLSSNFRSSGGVISAVNDVFAQCMSENVGGLEYGQEEMLYEGIPHIPLPDAEVELYGVEVDTDTYREEACFVAQRIQQLLDGNHMVRHGDQLRPIKAEDIVILLRSPGSVGGEFRYALEELGISCSMGNDLDLLQTQEIDTLRSILQIIHNPLQDIPLIAALSSPVFGFTANDLAAIRCKDRHSDFYFVLKSDASDKSIHFIEVLTQLRKDARFLTTTQLIHRIFVVTNMLSIYGSMEEGQGHVRNLQSFCQIAADFEGTGHKELSYFLDYLDAMEEMGLSGAERSVSGAVRIMSIHKSKGLEFPVVFICGLSRSINTSDIQKTVLCHKELGLGLTCVNTEQRIRFPSIAKRAIAAKILSESISEELRVLYVAMTRARDRMIMTFAAQKLADRLQDIVLRMDMSPKELMTANISCPGSWVLQTALSRTEAGEFFQLAGYPEQIQVSENPWSIHVAHAQPPTAIVLDESSPAEIITEEILAKMRFGLSFTYPYEVATTLPSKQTATQLKGRVKDQEAAEFTQKPSNQNTLRFRRAESAMPNVSGTDYGNAVHTFMQYADFNACTDSDRIRGELYRLVDRGLMSEMQADMVDTDSIQTFFKTPIGLKILNCREVLREFKFSILDDASNYCSEAHSDQVLLQGVIDCAFIEDDGITIIDFKTDAVTEGNVAIRAQNYHTQVSVYANALSRIYELPVKAAFLYFFRIGKLIPIM